MITPRTTPLNIPIAAPVLMEWLPVAVPPVANIKGTIPAMKANEVIRIGRRRARAPSKAESMREEPALLRCNANSTIKMAFFAKRPMSMIKPTWT